ncbi:MAG: FG-GAP-like repeat-containing protein [Acidimicrobiales bacterium]
MAGRRVVALVVGLALLAGLLVGVAPASARAAAEPPTDAAHGGTVSATASGVVDDQAPLPGDHARAALGGGPLVPGTVRVAPDRTAFRTPEPLDTPFMAEKTKGLIGGPDATPTITPGVLRSADLNGDGHADLALAFTAEWGGRADGFVGVMFGIGDGRFTDPAFTRLVPAGDGNTSRPNDFVVADVDGDGSLDLVASVDDALNGKLTLLRNAGDGSFEAPITSNAVVRPGLLHPGRWGGTRAVQLAVTGTGGMSVVDVAPDGFETITTTPVLWQNSTQPVWDTAVADADGDGQDEVYLAMGGGNDGQGVQRMTHLADPSPVVDFVAGSRVPTYRVAAGDLDGDGSPELVVSDVAFISYANRHFLRAMSLGGSSPLPAPVEVDRNAEDCRSVNDLFLVDLDGDGRRDVVAPSCGGGSLNTLVVARNDGGQLAVEQWISTHGSAPGPGSPGPNRTPAGSVVLDADGDGHPDVAWAGYNGNLATGIALIRGDAASPGHFVAAPVVDAGAPLNRSASYNADQAVLADWDGDGTLDLVLLRDADVVWRKGDGTAIFGPPQVITARTNDWCKPVAGELAVDDLDGDGHLDLVCHSQGLAGMAWGAGVGQPVTPVTLAVVPDYLNWNGFHEIHTVDLDGDGRKDIVMPVFSGDFDEGTYGYTWFLGAGRAWPATPAVARTGSSPTVAVGDVDGDGKPELVAYAYRRKDGTGTPQVVNQVIVWHADGAGGFTETTSPPFSDPPSQTGTQDYGGGLGDFDGDGKLDLVTATYYGNPYYFRLLLVHRGLGGGDFAAAGDRYDSWFAFDGNGYQRPGASIPTLDLDGDGKVDLVMPAAGYGLETLPGKGDGTFAGDARGRWSAGAMVASAAFGDIDGDGRVDAVVGTNQDNTYGPQQTHVVLMNRSVANAAAPPDLAVTAVSAPSTVGAGEDVSVQVTVTNQGGDVPAGASWTDAAWLSETDGFTLDATSIASAPRQGPLAAGASYQLTLTGPARAFVGGAHHLVVRTDAGGTVAESDEADDEATAPISVTVPTLVPGGAPVTVRAADGGSRLVRIPATAGQTVSVTATPVTAGAVRGRMGPDRAPKLGAGTGLRPTGTGPLVGATERATDGDLYVVVDGLAAAGAGTDVALTASAATVGLFTATPGRVTNGGPSTLTITGAGLDGASLELVPAAGASGAAVPATGLRAGGSPGTWFAGFSLTDQLGSFDLRATVGATTTVLPAAVVVEAPSTMPNPAEFDLQVAVPGRVRRHAPGPDGIEARAPYTGTVTIRNRTGRDLPAPLVRLEGVDIDVAWPTLDGQGWRLAPRPQPSPGKVFSFLGAVPGGPVDVIPARATVTVTFRFYATNAATYKVYSGVWAASDGGSLLDWSPEADGLAAAHGLDAAETARLKTRIDQLASHPTKPAAPGASAAGPWPTPGGYVLALGRAARLSDLGGRRPGSIDDLRAALLDEAVATADVGAPLTGRLVEPGGGEPGIPLRMLAVPVDGTGPTLRGVAAPDGRFGLLATPGQALTSEPYRIQVNGRLPFPAVEVAVPASAVSVPVTIGAEASGRVTRASDGTSVADARVTLTPIPGGGAPATAGYVTADTGVDGRYRAPGLAPGSYRLAVEADGLGRADRTVAVVAGGPTVADAVLAPAVTVTGTLRAPGGAATPGTVSAVLPGAPTVVLATATAGADGAFSLAGLAAGPVLLVATGPAGAATSTPLTLVGDVAQDVTLATPVTLTGAVVDAATHQPIAGAAVRFTSAVPAAGAGAATTTAADGTFALPGLPPGPGRLATIGPAGERGDARAIDPAVTPTVEVALAPAVHRVTVRVLDGGGSPLADLPIEVTATDPGAPYDVDARTGPDGSVAVAVPGPGTYRATAFAAEALATVSDGTADPEVTLTADVATLSGIVRAIGGTPVAGIDVDLVVDGSVSATATTDASGRYLLRVRPGVPVELWVRGATFGTARASLTPVAGPTAVDLAPGTGSVSFVVTGTAGPAAGALVELSPTGSTDRTPLVAVTTGADGVATFDRLPSGSWDALVEHPGHLRATRTVVVPVASPVAVALDAAPTITFGLQVPVGVDVTSATVVLAASDGSGVADVAAPAADGTVTFTTLPAGTYDVWVTVPGGALEQVAAGLALPVLAPLRVPLGRGTATTSAAPPASAPGASAPAASPGPSTPAAAGGAPAETPMLDYGGSGGFHGSLVSPNSTDYTPGASLPTVTVRQGSDRLNVPVAADGTFDVRGVDGPFVVEVTRPGAETRRYPVDWPSETSGTFELGLPEGANDDLRPEVAPSTPSASELLAAWFGEDVEGSSLWVDPLIDEILAATERTDCPVANDHLRKAKHWARLARELSILHDESLDQQRDAINQLKWETVVRGADVLADLASLFAPALKGAGLITSEVGTIARMFERIGRPLEEGVIASIISAGKDVTTQLIGLASTLREQGLAGAFGDLSSAADLLRAPINTFRDLLNAFQSQLDFQVQLAREAYMAGGPRTMSRLQAAMRAFPDIENRVAALSGHFGELLAAFDIVGKLQAGFDELGAQLNLVRSLKINTEQYKANYERAMDKAADEYRRSRLLVGSDCDEPRLEPPDGGTGGQAFDPNEIVGPAGLPGERWLADPVGLGYEVHFENLGPGTKNPPPGAQLATAPAADVTVTVQVPPTYDRSSFSFGDVGWGAINVDVPDGAQAFSIDQPITVTIDGKPVDLVVRVSGEFDPGTGTATWRYRTIDPATGLTPLDPLAGFLPPEPGDESGQGWARYTVDGAAGISPGTYLDQQASIVFDANAPIETNTWRNRVGGPRDVDAGDLFHPLAAPTRILDSRPAPEQVGPFATPWGPGTTREVQVAGVGGVPADATAVTLNVTVTGTSAASFLTVWPTGTPRPTASNLNWAAGQTIANAVTVKVGAGGAVSVFNPSGSTQVIVDVVGWYDRSGTGAGYTALTPARVLDSRPPPEQVGAYGTPWGAGTDRDVQVAGVGGVPADAEAVVANVTVTGTTAESFLAVYPDGASRPTASSLNWRPGTTIANAVTIKVGAGGKVRAFNNAGSAQVLIDVVGWFRSGSGDGFHPVSPVRFQDSRPAPEQVGAYGSPWAQGTTRTVAVSTAGAVPAEAKAVLANVTVTATSAESFLSVWDTGAARPTASNLNWRPGTTIANAVTAKVGAGDTISVFNNSGAVHVIADAAGWYG